MFELQHPVRGEMSDNIHVILRRHYPANSHVLMFEVGNTNGFRVSRYADVLVMSLWESRGLELHGIEIKSSRADWLKELKTPQKAGAIWRYCDRWYVLATAEGVVKKEELPTDWGYMVVRDNKLRTITQAAVVTPVTWTRGFITMMLKRAQSEVVARINMDASATEEQQLIRNKCESQIADIRKRNWDLLQQIDDFEKASGIAFRWENPTKVGAAVRLLTDGGQSTLQTIEATKKTIDKLSHALGLAVEELTLAKANQTKEITR